MGILQKKLSGRQGGQCNFQDVQAGRRRQIPYTRQAAAHGRTKLFRKYKNRCKQSAESRYRRTAQ